MLINIVLVCKKRKVLPLHFREENEKPRYRIDPGIWVYRQLTKE